MIMIGILVLDMILFIQGCQREVIKKRGTTFCVKLDGELPLLVRSFKDPPPILSEIISSDLDESQESIFWCKKISTVQQKIGIPVFIIPLKVTCGLYKGTACMQTFRLGTSLHI